MSLSLSFLSRSFHFLRTPFFVCVRVGAYLFVRCVHSFAVYVFVRWSATIREILRVFFVFFASTAFFNLLTLLYGSLSFLCLLNAVLDGMFALFFARHSGLVPHKAA